MPLKTLLALEAWWITLLLLQCFVHFFNIEIKHHKPIYWKWFIIRGSVALFYLFTVSVYGLGWYLAPVFVFQITSCFVLFNPTLNKLRSIKNPLAGFTFWYLGRDSGWFDSLFLKYKILHRITYYVSFILMCLSGCTLIELYYNY